MEPAKLKTFLECPVCLVLPTSKNFQCINSHNICETCYIKLAADGAMKQCPQGGCAYYKPPRRNRVLEAIVVNSTFEIACSKQGCNVEMKKDQISRHEVGCKFRTVVCPPVLC